MTDPLGQSQVIPYLEGLAKEGFDITILSCEKKIPYLKLSEEISVQLKRTGIRWEVIFYSKNPPVLSTVYDLLKLRKKAYALHKRERFKIIHCRSYISAFVGLWMKRRFDTRFIFDMRGFWADERVEGGIWDLGNPLYKVIYQFFKSKETQFLSEADHVISLTQKARTILNSRIDIPGQPFPVSVIPCCVDTDHFDPEKVIPAGQEKIKRELGVKEDDKILTYLGSLGTWYMVEEMLIFFKELNKEYPEYKFLFITKDNPGLIREKCKLLNIPGNKIIITAAERNELPSLLSVSSLAISFIMPSFSKSASSPTKLGELFSMGIPVICNKGVGDVDYLLKDEFPALLVEPTTMVDLIRDGWLKNINLNKVKLRNISLTHFSLAAGVKSYSEIYNKVIHV